MKNSTLIIIGICVLIVILLVISQFNKIKIEDDKLNIVVSFFPLKEFSKQVVGDMATVENIAGNNISPHDFEPSAKDIVKIEQADIFFYNGAGLDVWAENLKVDLEKKGVYVVELASVINLLDATSEELKSGEDDHNYGSKDPHFWVDPVNAKDEIKAILQALIQIDPENQEAYTKNAQAYISQLEQLHQDIQTGLSDCQQNTIVVSHDAFRYFSVRYELNTVSIAGLSPTNEPSTKKLAEISDIIRERDIKYVFFESLVSPRFSQVLADEIGIQTLSLDPVAGISETGQTNGESYISIMRQNLINLKIALQCHN